MMKHALLVDDDAELCKALAPYLKAKGFEVQTAASSLEAAGHMERRSMDLILIDLALEGSSGLDLIKTIRSGEPAAAIIVLTGNTHIESAVEAIKAGAQDYITKPFSHEQLSLAIEKALKEQRLLRQMAGLRHALDRQEEPLFLGKSPEALAALKQIQAVAPTELSVILEGESGTGKELLARLLHLNSPRREGPFLAIDCGALAENLVESELFGHERGAFTGADKAKAGLLEIAYGGTIFLDEINNLPITVQAKLLRALETRQIRHLGGKKDLPIDVRLVAASNKSLAKAIGEGHFRSDLYYRLNQFSLTVPPLRERGQDILLLAERFLKEANKELDKSAAFSKPTQALLQRYPWPGNVRELKHAITRACLLAGQIISPEHLPDEMTKSGKIPNGSAPRRAAKTKNNPLKNAQEEAQKRLLLDALKKTGHNKRKAAALLGIHRSVLYYKLKKYLD